MNENNFIQFKRNSKTEAFLIIGCQSLDEAKQFASPDHDEVVEISDDEIYSGKILIIKEEF